MSFITRNILRWGLIGGLALLGTSLLIGPERVAMGLSQVRAKAQNVVDSAMDDPAALRRQLEHLAQEYPDRIAEIRGEIAELDHQIGQVEKDLRVDQRVVALATDDLQELKTLVARAEAEGTSRTVSIRHEGVRFDIEEAYTEGRRINTVRGTYQDRLEQDKVQVQFLSEQKVRLTEILTKLQGEYDTYQAQLWQLDREIDAIQRNERLIELTKEQQATLQSYERFGKVQNLHQLQARLAELKMVQQAQLEELEKRGIHSNYEEQARYELDSNDINQNPFDDVIEIEMNGETENVEEPDHDTIAWAGPVVIE